jgi:hypothetical protein
MEREEMDMKWCRILGVKNKKGMEMVQVAILVAIAVTLGLVFKGQIGDFVDNTFQSLNNAKF